MRVISLAVVLALTLAVALTTGATANRHGHGGRGHQGGGGPGAPPYKDARLPVDRRVDDLLARMTLEEKVGQMTQINVTKLQGDPANDWDRAELNPDLMRVVLAQDKVGSILSGGGASPARNTPRDWAVMTNTIQQYALEHSRLGIPIIYGVDAVHGHNNVLGATMFPHQIGLGASFDRQLVNTLGGRTARAVRATGIHWNFSPVVDTERDLRWGRSYEPFGEDPLLTGTLGSESVLGQEGPGAPGPDRVASTLKHFVGYSAPDNGHDRTNATISTAQLQDIHLPPFAQGIDAGAETVMINSGSVNGVPVHGSHHLLTDVLRGQLGFKGVAISDWQDIENLQTKYHVVATYEDAVALGINSGIDMSMVPLDSTRFVGALAGDVRAGKVSQARVDEAVRRILALKFRLGLFERPYVNADQADAIVQDPADRVLARRAAAESLVLLENRGTLPLSPRSGRVLVTGPSADSPANQLGGWSIGWQGLTVPGEIPDVTTVREGVQQAARGATVRYEAGGPSDAERAAAVAAARDSDVVIAVVGEGPYAEGAGDSDTIALDPSQATFVDQLEATGKPVVLVVIAGRPLVMNQQLDGAAASLMAFLPGTEGGSAIADVLFGQTSPSGRLSVSWPRSVSQEPLHYDHPAGTPYDPRYPFGHGLSYGRFQIQGLDAQSGRNGWVRASADVAGSADQVVLAFVERPAGAPGATRQLVAFQRVGLGRGGRRRVDLSFSLSRLAVTQPSGERRVAPGTYRLVVGDRSRTFEVR
jgi:beta-glucosidase